MRLWGRDSYDCPTQELVTAGALAGVAGLLSAYPFDLLKTRIQSLPPSQEIPSALSIAKEIWRVGGCKVLVEGCRCTDDGDCTQQYGVLCDLCLVYASFN